MAGTGNDKPHRSDVSVACPTEFWPQVPSEIRHGTLVPAGQSCPAPLNLFPKADTFSQSPTRFN
jgi:hypothetical protein